MRALDQGIMQCLDCHALNELHRSHCRRCGAKVSPRRPASLARTWALLIAAMVFYIPANVLPMMTVISFGKGEPDTIMSGVIALVHVGMWPIALVVFVASILVPTFKLIGLTLLLYSVQRHVPMSAKQRIYMYRFIEWIGRWSMLDIFVIAILVALVRFDSLATVEAGSASIAFATVVVLTMLAAISFDPRLIWDNTDSENDHD